MNDVRRADSSMGGTVMDSSVIPTLSVARIACVAFQKKKKKKTVFPGSTDITWKINSTVHKIYYKLVFKAHFR